MRNDFCSNYLEHSAAGTTWRKKAAKYLSRVWKNGRWVYEYKITGKGYLRDAASYKKRGIRASEVATKALKERNGSKLQAAKKMSNYYAGKEIDAVYNYRDKSLAGQIEVGKSVIRDILDHFTTQTKETVTDTMTGKTREVTSGEKALFEEIEKQSKKKKK